MARAACRGQRCDQRQSLPPADIHIPNIPGSHPGRTLDLFRVTDPDRSHCMRNSARETPPSTPGGLFKTLPGELPAIPGELPAMRIMPRYPARGFQVNFFICSGLPVSEHR